MSRLAPTPYSALDLPPRRRGHPAVAENRAKRLDRIRCAALVLSGALMVKQAAGAFGITRQTVRVWIDEALGYDDPEAEGLRRLYASQN